jgi:phage terminase large subunit-like protein
MNTPIMAAFAGNRFGKTSAGMVKNLIDALDHEDIPEHLQQYKKWEPPFHCWVLGPTLQDSIESVILPEIRKWVPRHALVGGSWEKAYSVGRRTLSFRNGSQFKFFAYNQDHDQLTGAAVHRVTYDEPPPQKHRNEAMMRLATLNGDEMFTCTPLHGVSWLEKLIWKQRHDPDITVIKGSGLDNPIVNERALMRIIEQYPEEERQARLHGDFVHFAGRIFKEFNDRDHVVDAIKPHQLAGHEIVVGIDPGWDHGFAVCFAAFDVEGNCLIFDEILARGKTVEQVVNQIRSVLSSWGVTPEYYVIDSAGEQTSVITGYSVRSEFRRLGIPTRKAKNTAHSWQPSVDRIRSMLGHEVEVGEKRELRPRIKFTRDCPQTIDSMISYHYRDDADDLSRENRTPRPYKKDDDPVDAFRYVVMSRTYQDPFFSPQEEEEPEPNLHEVSAMGFHLEQLRREEEAELTAYGYY